MALENWECYEKKREELHANSYKTLGSYKGSPKTNFKDLKGKNGHSPMYSSTFEVKIQNISQLRHRRNRYVLEINNC